MNDTPLFSSLDDEAEYWFIFKQSDAETIPDRYRGTKAANKYLFGTHQNDSFRYIYPSVQSGYPLRLPRPKTDVPPNIDGNKWQKQLDDLKERLDDAKDCVAATERLLEHEKTFTAALKAERDDLKLRLNVMCELCDGLKEMDRALCRMEVDLGKVERAIGSIKFKEIVGK